MDILNIVDDFLNKKYLNLEDVVSQLNENNSLELIAKKYQLDSNLLLKKLTEAGYRYNNQLNKWVRYSEEKKSLSIPQDEPIKEPIESVDSSSDMYAIDIKQIVTELNNGTEIEHLANKLNISTDDLLKILQKNNYVYYDFANLWTNLTEKELVRELVTQLNMGFTIYDLSAKYINNKKARIHFVNTLENLLSKYNFVYNKKLKKWIKDKQLMAHDIVSLLNEGVGFQEIERMYDINSTNLRLLLKEHNYRYDFLYNIWTNKSEEQLLRDTANELSLNNKTWDDFILENNIKRELLYKKLREYKIEKPPISLQKENKEANNVDNPSIKMISNNQSTALSDEEIKIIKLIVQERMKNDAFSSDTSLVELKIFLPRNLLLELETYCELNGVSKSKLIQKLLEEYFKTI